MLETISTLPSGEVVAEVEGEGLNCVGSRFGIEIQGTRGESAKRTKTLKW